MACSIDPQLIEKIISFHGHSCPGLAIGIRASELALEKIGHHEDEDMVAVVETDMCGVDAIQYLTGCTYGKGNLIHKDYGKMAFSFYERKTGRGFRALLRPEIQGHDGDRLGMLMKKVFGNTATEDEKRAYQKLRDDMQARYLQAEFDEMFQVADATLPPPRPAAILQSLSCEICGELTMESRTRRYGGKTLCLPCFEKVEQKI